MPSSHRLNVTLDDERAAKLARMAADTHLNEGTLARSLLSAAIDQADLGARDALTLLNSIPGAFERAERGRKEVLTGKGIPLEKF